MAKHLNRSRHSVSELEPTLLITVRIGAATLVDGMAGFISFQLLRPKKANDPYVVMTFWESEAHFKA